MIVGYQKHLNPVKDNDPVVDRSSETEMKARKDRVCKSEGVDGLDPGTQIDEFLQWIQYPIICGTLAAHGRE